MMIYARLRVLYSTVSAAITEKSFSPKYRFLGAMLMASLWLCISLVLYHTAGGFPGLLVALALAFFAAAFFVGGVLMRLDKLATKRVHDERAMQALIGIYYALRPRRSLPCFRSAALSSDTILEYIRLIERLHPRVVVELGSGTSTVVAAYQLEKNGEGRVLALDHDPMWGEITRDLVTEHDLSRWVEVRIAPLVPVEVSGKSYQWYDPKLLEEIQEIDLLLIDGPPDHEGLGTRYPGLPLLADRLSATGVIVVDDCIMPRWKTIVLEWASENGFIVESRFHNEKDTLFLTRR